MSVAMYSALLCFLAYNFFFIHPRYTFFISASNGVTTVAIFLVAALICGRLANKLRTQVMLLRAANAHASALQYFGQRLTSAVDEDEAMQAATHALREALDADVVLVSKDETTGNLREIGQDIGTERYDPALQASVTRCLQQRQSSQKNIGHQDVRELSWHCLPVMLRDRILGAACFRFPVAMPQIPPEKVQLIDAMLRDLAQALARARLVHQLEEARVQGESERLRAALLSSVSHDLRSPLSTIIGSAESLSVYRNKLSVDDQLALARDIHSEGMRLDHYIQNLLDMTKVGHGSLAITREWIGLDEISGALVARLRKLYPPALVQLHLPDPAPLLYVHPALIEQALFNVLDNAIKFSPPNMPITMSATKLTDKLQIDVIDLGPGIPESEREQVFDRFYTSDRSDRSTPGTGLGLTICQGIVAAHGGEVLVLSGEHQIGAIIRITLPLDITPADAPKDD
jgi:two-component system sensor histidine kinase KdpD